jgi:hypothetical protein
MLAGSKPLAAFLNIHPSLDGDYGVPERELRHTLRPALSSSAKSLSLLRPVRALSKGQQRGSRRVL